VIQEVTGGRYMREDAMRIPPRKTTFLNSKGGSRHVSTPKQGKGGAIIFQDLGGREKGVFLGRMEICRNRGSLKEENGSAFYSVT